MGNWIQAASGLFMLPGGQHNERPVVAMVCGRRGEWIWRVTNGTDTKIAEGESTSKLVAMQDASTALECFRKFHRKQAA